MNAERLKLGRAIISGQLGGASTAEPLTRLVSILSGDCKRPPTCEPERWPDRLAECLADIDSAFEVASAREGELAAARASAAAERQRADSLEEELREARASLAEWHGEAPAADRARKAAERQLGDALESALVFGAADDESRDVLGRLAECLAGLPLAVLASAGQAGRLAELYLRAEVLTAEEPAERFERLRLKLAGSKESSE